MRRPAPLALLACVTAFAGSVAAVGAAEIDSPPPPVVWQLEGATAVPALTRPSLPRRPFADPDDAARAALGEALFRAPELLGTVARRSGLSCQACHIEGTANPQFFIRGLSARPGGLDVTSRLFNRRADDGTFNHRDIPSLAGVAATAPYGRAGKFPTLADFTRHAIVDEFDGEEPPPLVLDALVLFQRQLDFPANRNLDGAGRLSAKASAAAKRGEALFARPFPGQPRLSCAAYRLPAQAFTDRRRHDVGTGGAFDSPSLLGLAGTAPFFHDGRAASLAATVAHFDRHYGLGLSEAERADLLAYLAAVGGANARTEPVSLAGELARLDRFGTALALTYTEREAAVATIAVAVLRRELGALYERFSAPTHEPARDRLAALSRALQDLEAAFADEAWDAAAERLAAYRAAAAALGPALEDFRTDARFAPAR
jgi:cytochrome c peroxidase